MHSILRSAGEIRPFTAADLAQIAYDPASVESGSGRLKILFFEDRSVDEMQAAVAATGATVHHNSGYSLIISVHPPSSWRS